MLVSFIEVDGRPYSLELVKRIKSDDMFERENVLNQLLVRNRQVYMDSVTKVYNRRYYDERLKNLEGRFSFAMIDMDNFKHINDRFGHQAGDTTTAFRAVHTLKGVALNLGLGSRQLSDDGSAARGQDSMPESVQPLYVAVQEEHTAVCSALEQLEK